ncbi:hypothetical protein KDW_20150 [Dictyobacter vulcani]|uniref:Pyrrolo-quinoline quinone n=1 Tax=Dictyobacter vulcani TaxID=2607529 RepID=A0A5J4KJF0_9CHLR|nr:hypothetical protein [Dictyobacter vulcani]GER87853.1 hypothetical protein KDW_20150 [Dictyobacter vulcani]
MISQDSSAQNHDSTFKPFRPTLSMKRRQLFLALSFLVVFGVAGGSFLTLNLANPRFAHAASDSSAITTYKGNNARTGQNPNETILTTKNVTQNQFGKRVTYPVDGQIYSEPLYVPNLTINGQAHNVVFVETEHDSVYAFDADQTTPTNPLWKKSFLINGATTASNLDVSCNDMIPETGITGTPVLDPATSTMYVVALTKENGNLIYRLHALDFTSGAEKTGSPTVISGSVKGSGRGNVNGTLTFTPLVERQRSALLLSNGQVYIAFASFCDVGSYHGWIMSYDSSSLQQTHIYNNTPDGIGGGIWGAGGALTADSAGNIYTVSGNGDFNLNQAGGRNGGDSFIKLGPDLSTNANNYFTPFNQSCLQQADADLGSGGPVLIPNTNMMVGAGKEGRVYVIDRNNMGKYTSLPGLNCGATSNDRKRTDIDKVHQELPPASIGGMFSSPVYWNGTVYFNGVNDHIKAFKYNFSTDKLETAPYAQSPETFKFTGGDAVLSSNGTTIGTGILWAIDPLGILRAYDANNIYHEIYNSSQNSARDGLDSYVKFTTPTVANGQVFAGTKTSLTIYGLLDNVPQPTPTPISTVTPTPQPTGTPVTGGSGFNNAGIADDTNPGGSNFDGLHNSYSKQELQYNGINAGDNAFYNNMVFTWPDITSGSPDNYVANGQTVNVTSVSNANILGFLGSAAGGTSYGTATINYTDGSHQNFTLGFSDWTLGGGNAPISFGNGKMATLNYRDTPNGFQPVTNYIFYADVVMQTGKTVQSVTLPGKTTGGALHVFAIATKQGTVTTNPTPTVPYNNTGTSDDTNPGGAALDSKYSYSAQATQLAGLIPGASVNAYGATFVWPAANPGTPNNYLVQGQVIPVTPVDGAQTLAFLGSSTVGNSQGSTTITYTDGSTQAFSLGFSDWTLGGDNQSPAYGNQIAVTMPYRNFAGGKQSINNFVFYAEVSLQAGKMIQSVTLPGSTTGGQMHVFAIATTSTAANPTVAYNNAGSSDDNNPAGANLQSNYSYSAQALAAAGLKPGGSVIVNGTSFIWPSGIGHNNNYEANGQIVPVNAIYGASTLAFLGSSTLGPSAGTVVITYTDGTTQTENLGMSDWALGGGNQSPSYGNRVVSTMPYRNNSAGRQTMKNYVFYGEITLTNYKVSVKSITLPNNSHLHIFSVATR